MTNYYFINTSLPELQMGSLPELSYHKFLQLLDMNLKVSDKKKVRDLLRYFDIRNLRSLWMGEPLDRYGNFNEMELEEAILTGYGLGSYVYKFLQKNNTKELRLKNYPYIISRFFTEEIKQATGFLKTYLTCERESRLVFTALRSKAYSRDIMHELQYEEDMHDDMVVQIIAQKDAKTYEPPVEYEELKTLYEKYKNSPLELHHALSLWRFNKVSEWIGLDLMSMDRILGYLIQLIIVERWMALDETRGRQILETMQKDVL